ncbi:alpha/beta fold hydrolase [Algiphilus aromaticivorans]|uniref:alpha/beta fold hydrolase n=1 Tax=Algiphilus aromaticivorans TaxID=382454 RepID=UPI0005C23657|nr:alpha/beta hydrolase [Algiphilus aromaticivorans]
MHPHRNPKLSSSQPLSTPRGHFAWRSRGPETGRPVVLLHGWPESSYCWQPLAPYLPEDWRLIAPDLRGLGDSERTPERAAYTKDALAQDIWSILDELGVEQCELIGHDWGGIVAQEMALARPEAVSHLALANIFVINNVATNQRLAAGGMSRHQWYQYFLMTPLPEALVPGREREWLNVFLRDRRGELLPADAVDEYVRCHAIAGTPGSAANLYRALADDASRWARLTEHRFEMPATLIYGQHDKVITPAYYEGLHDCFGQIERIDLDAGHFVQEEQPEAFAEALLRRLS